MDRGDSARRLREDPGMHAPLRPTWTCSLRRSRRNPTLFRSRAREARTRSRRSRWRTRRGSGARARGRESTLSPAGKGPRDVPWMKSERAELRRLLAQRTWKRVAVIFAGPGMNILVAILLVALGLPLRRPGRPRPDGQGRQGNRPAASVGLRPGERSSRRTAPDPELRHRLPPHPRVEGQNPSPSRFCAAVRPVTLRPVRTKKLGSRWALGFQPGWKPSVTARSRR